jgi:hypothetical protein
LAESFLWSQCLPLVRQGLREFQVSTGAKITPPAKFAITYGDFSGGRLVIRHLQRLMTVSVKPSSATKTKASRPIPVKHAAAKTLKIKGAAKRRGKLGKPR